VTRPRPVTTTRRVKLELPLKVIADCQLPISNLFSSTRQKIGNWQSPIGNDKTISCADRYSYTRRAHSGSFQRLRRESQCQTPLQNASRVRPCPASRRRGRR